MNLEEVIDLQELTVEAPELKELQVVDCFTPPGARQLPPPVMSITARGLVVLDWKDSITQDAIGHQLPHLRHWEPSYSLSMEMMTLIVTTVIVV